MTRDSKFNLSKKKLKRSV